MERGRVRAMRAMRAAAAALAALFVLLAAGAVTFTDEGAVTFTDGQTVVFADEETQANLMNVETHTIQEIRDRVNNGVALNVPTEYEKKPSTEAPYDPGVLTGGTLNAGLATLNNIRYIAGLSDVELDDGYNQLAQSAALISAVNGWLSHNPEQPDDMEDELYWDCKAGAGSSNLGQGYASLFEDIVYGWMYDGDTSNIDVLGHRRWALNPLMGYTGLGACSYSYAMYAFDKSGSDYRYNVAWPAQKMPVDYFGTSYPWSVTTDGYESYDDVKVTLTRKRDQKTWEFSADSADGYFNVDNGSYGQSGAIIFRPSSVEDYEIGDVYSVLIEGLQDGPLSYDVEFFALKPVTDIKLSTELIVMEEGDTFSPSGLAEVVPEDATDPTLNWTVSDESIAKLVDDGYLSLYLEGLKPGTVTLTATTADGTISRSVKVEVTKRVEPAHDDPSGGEAFPDDGYYDEDGIWNQIIWDEDGNWHAGYYDENGDWVETGNNSNDDKISYRRQNLKVKAKAKTVKRSKLRKKAIKVRPITVRGAVGSVRYKIVGGNKKSKKVLKIDKRTGRVTVKKKTKKGTYKVRVKVTASAYYNYLPASKTVTVKIKVK